MSLRNVGAQAMDAETFYVKAVALKKKGMRMPPFPKT